MSRLDIESSTLSVLKDNISVAKAVLLVDVAQESANLPVSRFWSNRELPCSQANVAARQLFDLSAI